MIEAITFWIAKAVAEFLIAISIICFFILFIGVLILADKWSDR